MATHIHIHTKRRPSGVGKKVRDADPGEVFVSSHKGHKIYKQKGGGYSAYNNKGERLASDISSLSEIKQLISYATDDSAKTGDAEPKITTPLLGGNYWDNRELGKQGMMAHRPSRVGADVDYYDRSGNKQYGIVQSISGDVVVIKDAHTNKTVRMVVVGERPSPAWLKRRAEVVGDRGTYDASYQVGDNVIWNGVKAKFIASLKEQPGKVSIKLPSGMVKVVPENEIRKNVQDEESASDYK